MNVHELVDELYWAFAERLGEPLTTRARELPIVLRLAPGPRATWSQAFAHEATLGAPALVAHAFAGVSGSIVRDAVLAHMLAVIDAFGIDRIEHEQIEASAGLLALLGQARRERDRAMARLCGGTPPPDLDFASTDALTVRAIRRERSLLLSGRPVDFDTYERSSLDKQCVGPLASVALARAAGGDDRTCRAIRAMLQSVALALQTYDDVVDWEDDLERGGAWAVSLTKGLRSTPSSGVWPRDHNPDSMRARATVLKTGILRTMLERATAHVRAARRRATALGAQRLAAWAASRETRFLALVAAERRSAGYAVRAHALAAWAGEVLA
jgi:hypothetical protein